MRRTALALLFAGAFSLSNGSAALVYRQGEGWTAESEESGPQAKNAIEQNRKAEQFENDGDWGKAIGANRTLVKKFPTSSYAPKAQLKIGTFYEKTNDFNKAFDAYGLYLSKYPKGEDFDKAVEAQFRIARLFLEGERKRVLGIPTLSSMSKAQTMFEAIVKNAPYSKYAPLAQFNLGQALEKQGKYPEAIAAYQTLLVRYPNDPVAADAQYQIGFVYQTEARQGSNDSNAASKAREAFEDFASKFPNNEKNAQARENLKGLSGRETKGTMDIAKFYDKQKNYKAAVIYYNDVIKQQAGSPEAEAAKSRIEALKTQVGEDALRAGPEKTETGARAQQRRKLQAQVDTSSRPDYLGPPVIVPDEVAPAKPKLRTSPGNIGPVPAVEPPLPAQ